MSLDIHLFIQQLLLGVFDQSSRNVPTRWGETPSSDQSIGSIRCLSFHPIITARCLGGAEWEKINLMVKRKSGDRFCWHGGFPNFGNWMVFHLSQTGSPEYQPLHILSMREKTDQIYKLEGLKHQCKNRDSITKGTDIPMSDLYIYI